VRARARIGANATILPGVVVGCDAIIGAGAVVSRDVPDAVVAAGVPARVLKAVSELECFKGFFERPYLWPPHVDR
jgi:UDP-2-acetamido-3-amino-2,3-dideoxy-glucuronate N-acetyltransferase